MKQCPACGSASVRRSTIRQTDANVNPLHSPYRCRACGNRFWVISRRVRRSVIAMVAGAITVVSIVVGSVLWERYGPDSQATAVLAPGSGQGVDELPTGPISTRVGMEPLHPSSDPAPR